MNQTKPKQPQVKCPGCGRPQPKTLGPDGIYWCDHCKMQHDADQDEGGSFFNDPSKRMEVEERQQAQKQMRRRR